MNSNSSNNSNRNSSSGQDGNRGSNSSRGRRYNPNKKRSKKRPSNRNRSAEERNKSGEQASASAPYKKGRPSRNFRPKKPHFKGSNLAAIFKKFDYLMDMHTNARKKYYELYHRADKNQKAKLERNYYSTLEQIRKFESSLSEYHRAKLQSRFGEQKLDLTISEMDDNQQYFSDGAIADEQIVDPHLLESQIQCNFKDDTEESSGTIEDYNKLKQ